MVSNCLFIELFGMLGILHVKHEPVLLFNVVQLVKIAVLLKGQDLDEPM